MTSRVQACRAVVLIAVSLFLAGCGTHPGGPVDPASRTAALVGGRVHAAPDAPVVPDGVVLVRAGLIAAVGPRSEVSVPLGADVIDCAGATVTAGFWNSHVHFTQPVWSDAATAPAARLTEAFQAMLTSYGVVAALDTGSDPGNTDALRRRVESGEVLGPRIMRAGGSFVPPGGSPYYIHPIRLPELTSGPDTRAMVAAVADRGADGVKLFTGSWASRSSIVVMPREIVQAAAEAAHARGKFVIAHPSNSAGARVAIEGGVDMLAHTFPSELDRRPWDRALPKMMQERAMALVPTLKLFPYELKKVALPPNVVATVLGIAQDQLRAFADLGGQVLFGTDVGYMTDYDPTDEYLYMQAAGMSYARILAALTTAPAARFGAAAKTGRLAPGMIADVVVLDGNPDQEIRALAKVRYTLRGGRIIYRRARLSP
jgi:imidazolonepropionase-like amidohydrolase